MKYHKILFNKFEAKDISFVRRTRLLYDLKIVTHVVDKDLIKGDAEYCTHMIPKDGKCSNCGSDEGFVSEVILFQNG